MGIHRSRSHRSKCSFLWPKPPTILSCQENTPPQDLHLLVCLYLLLPCLPIQPWDGPTALASPWERQSTWRCLQKPGEVPAVLLLGLCTLPPAPSPGLDVDSPRGLRADRKPGLSGHAPPCSRVRVEPLPPGGSDSPELRTRPSPTLPQGGQRRGHGGMLEVLPWRGLAEPSHRGQSGARHRPPLEKEKQRPHDPTTHTE